jgi:hypothetical protein
MNKVYHDALALMSGTAEKDVERTHREPVYALPSCVQCWHVLCETCLVEGRTLKAVSYGAVAVNI